MIELNYEREFKNLQGVSSVFKLNGPFVIVEMLPQLELKTASGLFIGKADSHKQQASDFRPSMGVVIYEGTGYTDGSEMSVKVGNVVSVPLGAKYLSEFPGLGDYTQNTLAIVNEGDILFYFDSLATYETGAGAIMHGQI